MNCLTGRKFKCPRWGLWSKVSSLPFQARFCVVSLLHCFLLFNSNSLYLETPAILWLSNPTQTARDLNSNHVKPCMSNVLLFLFQCVLNCFRLAHRTNEPEFVLPALHPTTRHTCKSLLMSELPCHYTHGQLLEFSFLTWILLLRRNARSISLAIILHNIPVKEFIRGNIWSPVRIKIGSNIENAGE